MNVTLAMSPDLVADSRRYAAEHGTTLNALIRAYLDGLRERRQEAAARKRDADELLALLEDGGHASPPGWKFSRDEIHDRDTERGW